MEINIDRPWEKMLEKMTEAERNDFVNRAIYVMIKKENEVA